MCSGLAPIWELSKYSRFGTEQTIGATNRTTLHGIVVHYFEDYRYSFSDFIMNDPATVKNKSRLFNILNSLGVSVRRNWFWPDTCMMQHLHSGC